MLIQCPNCWEGFCVIGLSAGLTITAFVLAPLPVGLIGLIFTSAIAAFTYTEMEYREIQATRIYQREFTPLFNAHIPLMQQQEV